MAIVTKAEEKFKRVSESLGDNYTDQEYVEKFKELYPKDWDKVERRYKEHEAQKLKQKGRPHPMPRPDKYILNISHKFRNN